MTSLPAGVYEHFKGGFYQLIGVAQHTDTGDWLVIYIPLTGNDKPGPRLQARPLQQWAEFVMWPDGVSSPRFYWVGLVIPPEYRARAR